MRRKLYGNTIPPSCEYCMHGRRASDGKAVLCPRKGIVPMYHKCRKYEYDPLQRVPRRTPPLRRFNEDDFRID